MPSPFQASPSSIISDDAFSAEVAKVVAQLMPRECSHEKQALVASLRVQQEAAQLHAQFQALMDEAAVQYGVWRRASSNTPRRPKGYRLPQFPASYAALTPVENPELSAEDQTDLNYNNALIALLICSQLVLSQCVIPSYAQPVLIRDGAGLLYAVTTKDGQTPAQLKKAYRQSVRRAEKISPENYLPEVVFADLVTQGNACKGPLGLLDWSA